MPLFAPAAHGSFVDFADRHSDLQQQLAMASQPGFQPGAKFYEYKIRLY